MSKTTHTHSHTQARTIPSPPGPHCVFTLAFYAAVKDDTSHIIKRWEKLVVNGGGVWYTARL